MVKCCNLPTPLEISTERRFSLFSYSVQPLVHNTLECAQLLPHWQQPWELHATTICDFFQVPMQQTLPHQPIWPFMCSCRGDRSAAQQTIGSAPLDLWSPYLLSQVSQGITVTAAHPSHLGVGFAPRLFEPNGHIFLSRPQCHIPYTRPGSMMRHHTWSAGLLIVMSIHVHQARCTSCSWTWGPDFEHLGSKIDVRRPTSALRKTQAPILPDSRPAPQSLLDGGMDFRRSPPSLGLGFATGWSFGGLRLPTTCSLFMAVSIPSRVFDLVRRSTQDQWSNRLLPPLKSQSLTLKLQL